VAEETFVKDSSIKQFVTSSFNSLSSQLVRSALHKRIPEDSEAKIINCLSNTLTHQSNIVLVACVNPSPGAIEHSVPAVKFIARIRDCIVRKLT
jgi:hypothetical protein